MDVINKSAELLVSQVGHLAFDIDRALLLMLLGNFYGLASSLADEKSQDGLPTKTEIRLRSRLALDICNIIFNKNISGIPLTLKPDSSTVQTHWAYQLTFILGDEENCSFRILLDDSHTDYILNLIRRSEHGEKKKQIDKVSAETRKNADQRNHSYVAANHERQDCGNPSQCCRPDNNQARGYFAYRNA